MVDSLTVNENNGCYLPSCYCFMCVCVFLQESLLDADHQVAVALGPADTPGSSVRTKDILMFSACQVTSRCFRWIIRISGVKFCTSIFLTSNLKCFQTNTTEEDEKEIQEATVGLVASAWILQLQQFYQYWMVFTFLGRKDVFTLLPGFSTVYWNPVEHSGSQWVSVTHQSAA